MAKGSVMRATPRFGWTTSSRSSLVATRSGNNSLRGNGSRSTGSRRRLTHPEDARSGTAGRRDRRVGTAYSVRQSGVAEEGAAVAAGLRQLGPARLVQPLLVADDSLHAAGPVPVLDQGQPAEGLEADGAAGGPARGRLRLDRRPPVRRVG